LKTVDWCGKARNCIWAAPANVGGYLEVHRAGVRRGIAAISAVNDRCRRRYCTVIGALIFFLPQISRSSRAPFLLAYSVGATITTAIRRCMLHRETVA
jgi:hypothetical protein